MRLSDADAVGTFSSTYGCPNVCPHWTFLGVWSGTKGLSTHAGSTCQSFLEMSPFCVVVFSLECALKRSPVVRAKRKCVFQRAALRSLGWKTMASSSANPGATDGLS